ncbi:MAG TPA: PKD domain-containing protein [Edaphocola sp.]|nr:PKD domain-containing protein [Edaphocola sp.]
MKIIKFIQNAALGGLLLFSAMIKGHESYAQTSTVTTSTTYTINNGSGITTFNFQNTNPYPIIIDSVYAGTYSGTGDCTFYLWYNLTPVNGQPAGAIPTTAGWVAADTEVVNITASQTMQPVLTNVGLVIPPNTTLGMAVGGFFGVNGTTSGAMGYHTLTAGNGNSTFSGGGGEIITGDNVSYGATSYTTTFYNYPRGFVGSIVFEKQGVPDNAGIDSIINPNGSFCSGTRELKVRLRNFGLNTLHSVDIYWAIDGQQFGPLAYNTPVDSMSSPNNWAVVSLGMVNFPYDTVRQLKVWTSLPNGVTDNQLENDTTHAGITANMQNVTSRIWPGDTTICEGSSVILDAGQQPAGCIFIWSNGAVTQSTSVGQAGDYSVIVQSSQGCFAYDTVTVTERPKPIAGTFGVVDNGNRHFTFTPAGEQNVTGYFWNFGDGHTLSATSGAPQYHQYAQDGAYAVTLKEGNPCDTVAIAQQVYVAATPNGIQAVDNDLAAAVKIYPNPARDKAVIVTKGVRMERIILLNVLGEKIYEAPAGRPYSHQVDLSGIASGVYNISVYTDKGVVMKKLNVFR